MTAEATGTCCDPYDYDIDVDPPGSIMFEDPPAHHHHLDEVLKRFPHWEVDWENAEQAHTSTVRGWERLPVFTS